MIEKAYIVPWEACCSLPFLLTHAQLASLSRLGPPAQEMVQLTVYLAFLLKLMQSSMKT